MRMTTQMDDLPDEMLEVMFSYCRHADLVQSIQLVSCRWKRVSQAPLVWRRIVYRPSRRDSLTNITHMLQLSPMLQVIDFQERRFPNDEIFQVIAENCPELRKLLLHTHQDLSIKSLKALRNRCLNLQYLKITDKILMSPKNCETVGQFKHLKTLSIHGDFGFITLKGIADGSPHLEELELIRVDYEMSDLKYLIQRKKNYLHTLNIECSGNGCCTLSLLSACKALKKLNVHLCDHDAKVEAIGKLKTMTSLAWTSVEMDVHHVVRVFDNRNIAQLVELNISCFYSYNDRVTKVIVNNCPLLRKITLSCEELTDESLRFLKQLKELTCLCISWNSYITERGILYLQDVEQLKDLALYGCASLTGYKGFTKACLQAVTKLHRLNVLKFHCQDLEDLPVELIARRMSSLSWLDINKCFNVDVTAIEYLKKLIPHIRISMTQVPQSPQALYGRPIALNAAGIY